MTLIESLIVFGVTAGIVAGVFGFGLLMNRLIQDDGQPFSREIQE